IHPTTVQPRKTFSRKIVPAWRLLRPRIAGKKYMSAKKNKKATMTPPSDSYRPMESAAVLVLVHHFARLDPNSQAIPGQRQRARRIRVIRAGRVVCFVEIENHHAILRRRRIKESRRRICFLAARQIAEYKKHSLLIGRLRFETILLPVQRERDVARHPSLDRVSHDVL